MLKDETRHEIARAQALGPGAIGAAVRGELRLRLRAIFEQIALQEAERARQMKAWEQQFLDHIRPRHVEKLQELLCTPEPRPESRLKRLRRWTREGIARARALALQAQPVAPVLPLVPVFSGRVCSVADAWRVRRW